MEGSTSTPISVSSLINHDEDLVESVVLSKSSHESSEESMDEFENVSMENGVPGKATLV